MEDLEICLWKLMLGDRDSSTGESMRVSSSEKDKKCRECRGYDFDCPKYQHYDGLNNVEDLREMRRENEKI